jgi:hypothetical protein
LEEKTGNNLNLHKQYHITKINQGKKKRERDKRKQTGGKEVVGLKTRDMIRK